MVRGRRVTSSGGRGEDSGRRFDPTQQASGSGPLSPSSLPAVGPATSASPSQMASGSTPFSSLPLPAGALHTDDQASHHEGDVTHPESMRPVWINEGNKLEPAQASQFITKSIQAHFPGPIHQFSDFSMDVQDILFDMFMKNHRFASHSDELRARVAWTNTARANFKNLLYHIRKNAERDCASTDRNLWKEHGPAWMRKEYWVALCDIWTRESWIEKSAKAKINRATNPDANIHTSGSVSFATHKSRLETQLKRPPQFQEVFDNTHKRKGSENYVSQRAREVAESYMRGMEEKYGDDSPRPELDPDVWVAASGAPKKGHVYGFGHSIGTTRVLSSCSSAASHATSPFTTPSGPGGSSRDVLPMTPTQFREIVNETVNQNMREMVNETVNQNMSQLLSQNISQIVSQNISQIVSQTISQTLAQMGFAGDRAPPTQQSQPSRGVGEDDQDDIDAEDL